jgi:hypothetical protein
MGLYLRKSVRVGPFRFNLSGSGVGVSCGIPGLRVGVGPRGNYIHAGRGGIYYRASFPRGSGTHSEVSPTVVPTPTVDQPRYDPTLAEFHSVDTGVSLDVHDISSQALLDELNEKRAKHRLTPWTVVFCAAIEALIWANNFATWEIATITALCIPLIVISTLRDVLKKTSVLLFDFDSETALQYAEVTTAFDHAAASDRIWHIRAAASVLDRKYHAGAANVLDTSSAGLTKAAPPGVKTNIQPLTIKTPNRTVYLFPDRALILDAAGFGAANYQQLRVEIQGSTFITGDTTAPRDARIVEYTWRYVNKRGGPDHRFANNPQLPIIETRDLSLSDPSGFHLALKFSNANAADGLHNAIQSLANRRGTIAAKPSNAAAEVTATAPSDEHVDRRSVFVPLLAMICIGGIGSVLSLHDWTPQLLNSTRQSIATPSEAITQTTTQTGSRVLSPRPPITQTPAPIAPPPTRNSSAAAMPAAKYVTLIHDAAIVTPTGRTVLRKGIRLPVTRIKRESVVVRYFDGGDYEVPRSTTDHP